MGYSQQFFDVVNNLISRIYCTFEFKFGLEPYIVKQNRQQILERRYRYFELTSKLKGLKPSDMMSVYYILMKHRVTESEVEYWLNVICIPQREIVCTTQYYQ